MKNKSEQWMRYASLLCISFALLGGMYPPFQTITILILLGLQIILFIKASDFSHQEKGSSRFQTYRLLCFLCLVVCFGFFFFQETTGDMNRKDSYLMFAFLLIFGNYAPKIPFNRTLGLRLPWTIRNERTWRYAHRMIGYLSIPCAFLYLLGIWLSLDGLSIFAFLTWIVIPTLASYRFDKERREHEKD